MKKMTEKICARLRIAVSGIVVRRKILPRALLLWALSLSTMVNAGQHGVPNVVVSIAPLHSLVSGVMQGVAEPGLLIEGGQSPHSSYLAPSAHRKIAAADLLIWLGPSFELSLRKAVEPLTPPTRVIGLLSAEGMHRLETRQGGDWGGQHSHADVPGEGLLADARLDPHLWLSSENASRIVTLVAQSLAEIDPQRADVYHSNQRQMLENIAQLRQELMGDLAPLSAVPYLVFHDAYHYFEDEYGLMPVAAVTLNPERKPGARSIVAIRKLITEKNVRCLFSEPQFEPGLMKRLSEDTGVRTAELDPLGANIAPGPDQWFALMRAMRDGLQACLN